MGKGGTIALERSEDPLGSRDVEGTINPWRITTPNFSFFLNLPSLCFTVYSLDYKIDMKVGLFLDNKPLPSPFPLV
jgi:hypothetical protein